MRNMRLATLWNVPDVTALALSTPTLSSSRSFISRAALFVNVMHRMCDGGTPHSLMRCVTRPTSTRVFPDPGPASTFMGAIGARMAALCSSFMPSRCAVDGGGAIGMLFTDCRHASSRGGVGGGLGNAAVTAWRRLEDATRQGTCPPTFPIALP